MLKDFLMFWRCFCSPCHKWQFFLWSQREIVKPQQWKKKDTVYLYLCMKATPWHRLSRVPGASWTRLNHGPQQTGTKWCQASCLSSAPPLLSAAWNPNVCLVFRWWLGCRVLEQLPLELAALFENTGKGERGGTGDRTQPSTQDAHAGGCGRVFSVVFLWPLVPLNSCYGRKHHKAPETCSLGMPLRCPKKKCHSFPASCMWLDGQPVSVHHTSGSAQIFPFKAAGFEPHLLILALFMYYSTVVLATEKEPCVSGPVQFKPWYSRVDCTS